MGRPARTALRRVAAAAALAGLGACGHAAPSGAADTAVHGHLRGDAARANPDPTVIGARVLPESIAEDRALGLEPGGGARAIAAGVRVVSLPGGALLAADDRLPQTPSFTTALPERLGGGFLFVLGPTVWRSPLWLAPIKPIFTSPSVIARVVVGLDRVYLRAPNGSHQAIDPRSGARLDLGPWPGSSFVGAYAAADGWRAVAVNDLRGLVATFDAGATWTPLGLPMDPKDVVVAGDLIVVSGQDAARGTTWYEVRPDGQVGRTTVDAIALASGERGAGPVSEGLRIFGKRPLVAAIEDGWPLADGTAIVARDGALGRVRLSDGALVDVARDAYALKPSRCHALPLGRDGSIGFACGEPRGKTALYTYDPASGGLLEQRRFDAPRAVLAAGNGAVAVRGGCAEGAPSDEDGAERSYCIRPLDGAWREVRVRGTTGGERVVVLRDGRVAVVTPPEGSLAAARLTLLDRGQARTMPIAFPAFDADVARVVRAGAWLDGLEERKPGTLSGWIEAAGTFLGIQIDTDGNARVGKLIRDLGAPMVSGRYGLGWSPARRGYETTDGGMTWTSLDLPEPLVVPRMIASRACGPIGCTAAGWLRVGWGEAKRPPLPEPPPVQRASSLVATPLDLDCELLAPTGTSKAPPSPARGQPAHAPSTPMPPTLPLHGGFTVLGSLGGSPPADLSPFYASPPPPLRPDDTALSAEALDVIARAARTGPLARLFAWGPKSGEWDHASHWALRWVWPYGGSAEVRSTAPSPTPFPSIEAARRMLGAGPAPSAFWTFALGDDAQHGLFLGRRNGPVESTVLLVEEGRPIAEAHRADREPFGEIEGATRAGRRWYVATTQGTSELPATIVWQLEGTTARELARIPRAGFDARPFATQLARRADGRSIGLVVDGQPNADRYLPARWIVPIDTETGKAGDPEPLGMTDLADRPPIDVCHGDEGGWVLDVPWTGAPVRLRVGDQSLGAMQSLMARLHLRRDRACVEAVSGSLEYAQLARAESARPALREGDKKSVTRRDDDSSSGAFVSVYAARARHALRCVRRSGPNESTPR